MLTDLPPEAVGPCWYRLRTWVELGFRALKLLGWHWERTRRSDPDRVAWHWLVLSVATLWVVATGTREEDAVDRGRAPPAGRRLTISVVARGLVRVRWQLLRMRRLWTRLWP
ncbi:MAG: transposase, partial [Chloroflexota bacterium]|nr:transposase [Chloroflexota bacterium]